MSSKAEPLEIENPVSIAVVCLTASCYRALEQLLAKARYMALPHNTAIEQYMTVVRQFTNQHHAHPPRSFSTLLQDMWSFTDRDFSARTCLQLQTNPDTEQAVRHV